MYSFKITISLSMFMLNIKGKIFKAETPVVMGIINTTPDSFYKGSLANAEHEILSMAKKMVDEGAAILDIGGQSTRPGSKRVDINEEMKRVIPAIKMIRSSLPGIIISIDTYQSEVAKAAVDAGADIINDISAGGMDKTMIKTVAALKIPYICMHMQGTPETMHKDPVYTNVVKEVLDFFTRKIDECRQAGIKDIIIDPGFGFGKTISHNFSLLKELHVFSMLGKPVLAGLSRKSTIYRTLGISPEESLNGTTVLNTLAIENGASILRVHDVKPTVEVIALMNAYKKPLLC